MVLSCGVFKTLRNASLLHIVKESHFLVSLVKNSHQKESVFKDIFSEPLIKFFAFVVEKKNLRQRNGRQ